MKTDAKYRNQLLVEGNDDQHVVWALCKKFGILENFDVINCQGIENIFQQLPLRFKQSEIESIGIIIDADIEILNRWQSLKVILNNQGFIVPESLPENGLIISNSTIKVGVWIMPNNNLNGMLEDFISFLVPPNDKILEIINKNLEDIEAQNLNNYSIIHKSKAKIHSWLALQSEPGTPMGLSITKKYLTTDNESCRKFIEWLKKVFE